MATATGRVLVVDDEAFFQALFRDLLQAAGHQVRVAASGDAALKLMAEEHFDLLVTDVVMPGLDGIALVREARRRDPDLEAVAVTGHDDVRLAVQAMKGGCADFLTNPVDGAELVQVCERALARVRLRREHSQLLSENVEFAKSQALHRQGLQLLATLDGERLHDLALSVLARVTDAQGAALWIADEKGMLALRGYRGLVDRARLPARIDPRQPAWASVLAQPVPSAAPGVKDAGEAFLVPFLADEEPVGLALLSDGARGGFAAEQHAAALTVADFAAIAVKNARRFQALERIGLRDRETGAYNLAYFIDYTGKEFYKARRYGRAFSLVILSIDNAAQMRKEGGREPYRCATSSARSRASCATPTSSRRSRRASTTCSSPRPTTSAPSCSRAGRSRRRAARSPSASWSAAARCCSRWAPPPSRRTGRTSTSCCTGRGCGSRRNAARSCAGSTSATSRRT